MSQQLIALRNIVEQTVDATADTGGKVSTQAVIEAVRSQCPAVIEACSTQLEDIGLTRLIGEVGRRARDPVRSFPQPDLFSGFSGIPKLIVLPSDGDRFAKILFEKATLQEVDEWLEDKHSPVSKRKRRVGVAALLQELRQYASDDQTVEDALRARANKKKAA